MLPLVTAHQELYNYGKLEAVQHQMTERQGNTKRKTTIELSDEQYFFLKEKALELQKQNHSASLVSLIRELIEKDRQEWIKRKACHEDQNRPDS